MTTSPKRLEPFWCWAETPQAALSPYGLSLSLGDVVTWLQAEQLIRLGEPAESIVCPACGDHEEVPLRLPSSTGVPRPFIPCPLFGRVELDSADIEQWWVDAGRLAHLVARLLGLGGECRLLMSARLWRLGRTAIQGVRRDILLAFGLASERSLRTAVCQSHHPVVLVPTQLPAPDYWQGAIPPVIPLNEITTLTGSGLAADLEQLLARVLAADQPRPSNAHSITNLKEVVRWQIKAERQTALTDDCLVAAYRRFGSLRKTAQNLSQELERTVTKDQVAAAVRRAGGATKVLGRRPARARKTGRLSWDCDSRKKIASALEGMPPK